nr:hypothetical protein [Bacteroidales bacterium]
WGTGNKPTQNSTKNSDYATFTDWGTKIGTGWRTLSQEEWDYLLKYRPDAENKSFFGFIATINTEINDTTSYKVGLILLPDTWTAPAKSDDNQDHIYSSDEWNLMSNAGAVFIPATSAKNGVKNLGDEMIGHYWTSTSYDDTERAIRIDINHRVTVDKNKQGLISYQNGNLFHVYGFNYCEYSRHQQNAVRLVRDAN